MEVVQPAPEQDQGVIRNGRYHQSTEALNSLLKLDVSQAGLVIVCALRHHFPVWEVLFESAKMSTDALQGLDRSGVVAARWFQDPEIGEAFLYAVKSHQKARQKIESQEAQKQPSPPQEVVPEHHDKAIMNFEPLSNTGSTGTPISPQPRRLPEDAPSGVSLQKSSFPQKEGIENGDEGDGFDRSWKQYLETGFLSPQSLQGNTALCAVNDPWQELVNNIKLSPETVSPSARVVNRFLSSDAGDDSASKFENPWTGLVDRALIPSSQLVNL